jgi:transcriptional regulator of acetoin/glycerol metabolism
VLAPNLEPDVNCAAAVGVPVLISAGDPDGAEWLARLIHARSKRRSEPFVVYHPGRGEQLRLLKPLLNGSGPGRGTLFVADVERANRDVQAFLRDMLSMPSLDRKAPFRIIAATTTWLFEHVQRGEFDDLLFYRLNKIHIRVEALERTSRADVSVRRSVDAPREITPMNLEAFRRNRLMLRAGHVPLHPQPASVLRHG